MSSTSGKAPTLAGDGASKSTPSKQIKGINVNNSTPATSPLSVSANAPVLIFQSTEFEIIDRDGQPWLRGLQIGGALGYADESSINRIYARRSSEFTAGMTGTVKLTDPNGDLQDTRIFSLRGAHLLAMFARTSIAALFRKWVLDILDHQTAPVTHAIDYTRISPAQAQHLKEIVADIVASGKQTYPETWARLQRKFRANSYLELPAARFDDACDYLTAKLPEVTTLPAADRFMPTLAAANAVAAQVQAAVFKAMLSGDKRWQNERWMLSFNVDRDNVAIPYAAQIESDAFVMSLAYLAKAILEPRGMLLSNTELANLMTACGQRLASRFANDVARAARTSSLVPA